MIEWRETKLSELCDSIDYGYTASATELPVGPKFLRITDIVQNQLRWDSVPYTTCPMNIYEKFKLHDGDIVIARTGATTGESLYISRPPEAIFASYLVRLRINSENDPRYIAYWLKSPYFRNYLNGVLGDKSAQPNASASTMTNAPIRLPRLRSDQEAVSSVLASLDDKIELNRRMNETLEAMAQAIFRDWFVDFGPTRRKLAGITDPVEIMGGLVQDATHAAELAALFPNALGDDGLPEGWEKKPVGELAYIRGGKQLPKDEFDPAGNVPIFGGAGLMGFTNKSNADGFVITIGRVGAYCGKLFTYRGRAWVNNNASQFIPKSSVPPEWLYLSLCQLDIHNIRRGAAQPFVSNSDLAALSVVVPDDSILPQFMWLVTPIIIKSEQAASESRILAATRDLLLPKLMSGEIRLREAEKIAEAVP